MCGLMGGSGKLDLEVVRSLCCQNVTRGRDSAGIAWVEDQKAIIEKVAEHPLVAFNKTLSPGLSRAAKSGTMLGHTRAATTGHIVDKNAHPFLVGGIAFAHNGIIMNHEKFGKYQVDSQCLIHGIVKKNFAKFVGSIALIWIEKGKLHAYRRGNPLHRGFKDGALYLASESIFLQRVGCEKIKELVEGVIYTFDHGKVKSTKPVPKNKVWDIVSVLPTHQEQFFNRHQAILDIPDRGRHTRMEDDQDVYILPTDPDMDGPTDDLPPDLKLGRSEK